MGIRIASLPVQRNAIKETDNVGYDLLTRAKRFFSFQEESKHHSLTERLGIYKHITIFKIKFVFVEDK